MTETEWISCKEELPPIGQRINVNKRAATYLDGVYLSDRDEGQIKWVWKSGLFAAILEASDSWSKIE